MHFQIVSRLFEVEGFHRLIDVLELWRAGHFEASRNVFGFFEAPCINTALNVLFADPIVNVPDLAPLNEAGCRFPCH